MRRRLLLAALAAPGAAGAAAQPTQPLLRVWRDPNCGCCTGWVEHMRAAGFRVEDNVVASPAPVRRMLGIPSDLLSCHAAAVDGYALEGHVPAQAVLRLLAERPAGVRGLAVPAADGVSGNGGARPAGRRVRCRRFRRQRGPPRVHALPGRPGDLTALHRA